MKPLICRTITHNLSISFTSKEAALLSSYGWNLVSFEAHKEMHKFVTGVHMVFGIHPPRSKRFRAIFAVTVENRDVRMNPEVNQLALCNSLITELKRIVIKIKARSK